MLQLHMCLLLERVHSLILYPLPSCLAVYSDLIMYAKREALLLIIAIAGIYHSSMLRQLYEGPMHP